MTETPRKDPANALPGYELQQEIEGRPRITSSSGKRAIKCRLLGSIHSSFIGWVVK